MSSVFTNAKSCSKSQTSETQGVSAILNFFLTLYANHSDGIYTLSDVEKTSESHLENSKQFQEADFIINKDIKIDITSQNDIITKIKQINGIIDGACITYSSISINLYFLTDNESPFSIYAFFAVNYLTFLKNSSSNLYSCINYSKCTIQTLFYKGLSVTSTGAQNLVKTITVAGKATKDKSNQILNTIGQNNYDETPKNVIVQIAALLSHYVYFYLDWLEVYWDDYTGKKSKQFDVNPDWDYDGDLIMVALINNGVPLKTMIRGFVRFKSSKIKVKLRVVGRIIEILNIVENYFPSKEDKKNKNYSKSQLENRWKIIDGILNTCKERKCPVDFFELYEICGYWSNDNNKFHTSYLGKRSGMYNTIKAFVTEAKFWHICHPMEVARKKGIGLNLLDKLSHSLKKEKYDSETNKKEDRNRTEVFRKYTLEAKNDKKGNYQYDFYFTPLLHTGIDRLSGYGGALFVCAEENKKPEFIYSTKGTDFNSLNDWILVDLLQAFTGFSLQHVHTLANAHTIDLNIRKGKYNGVPLTFVGHSLGGGLASSNAIIAEGRHAITFNAASLNFIGSLATRALAGIDGISRLKWSQIKDAILPMEVAKRVHPIRIEGETIDVLQIAGRFLSGGTCERGYGAYPLIFANNKDSVVWGHGMCNFLFASMLQTLGEQGIVNKTTLVQAENKVDAISDAATLDTVKFENIDSNKIILIKDNITKFLDIFESANKRS